RRRRARRRPCRRGRFAPPSGNAPRTSGPERNVCRCPRPELRVPVPPSRWSRESAAAIRLLLGEPCHRRRRRPKTHFDPSRIGQARRGTRPSPAGAATPCLETPSLLPDPNVFLARFLQYGRVRIGAVPYVQQPLVPSAGG